MSKKYYAGIGSRLTPNDILIQMSTIAFVLSNKEYILRSGGATGSDSAFAAGAHSGLVEIFRPDDFINKNGRFVFPSWVDSEVKKYCLECDIDKMKPYAAALIKRNMMQILGKDGSSPVDFVLCWTPTMDPLDKDAGGTRYATRCAENHGIPILNMRNKNHLKVINDVILNKKD